MTHIKHALSHTHRYIFNTFNNRGDHEHTPKSLVDFEVCHSRQGGKHEITKTIFKERHSKNVIAEFTLKSSAKWFHVTIQSNFYK